MLCFLLGFNFCNIADKISYWYNSIIVSESCLISFVLLLLCFRICLPRSKNPLVRFAFLPIFVFIISGSKISTGLIFFLALSYLFFRDNPKAIKNWLAIFFYALVFGVAYYCFAYGSSHGNNDSTVKVLAFVRTYVPTMYWFLHYFFYFIPVIFLFKYKINGKFLSKEYFLCKENVWAELAFLLTVGSWLPGLLFDIAHGSAAYFYFPAFLITCLILWGSGVLDSFYCSILQNVKYPHLNVWFNAIIIIFLVFPTIENIHIKENMISTVKGGNIKTLSVETERLSKKEKLALCFSQAESTADNRYKALCEVRKITSKNKKDYCIFISKDSWISELYEANEHSGAEWNLRGAYIVASFYGLPVINAFYENNELLYRWDDERIARAEDAMFYGLESVIVKNKGTKDNMVEYAKKIVGIEEMRKKWYDIAL